MDEYRGEVISLSASRGLHEWPANAQYVPRSRGTLACAYLRACVRACVRECARRAFRSASARREKERVDARAPSARVLRRSVRIKRAKRTRDCHRRWV